jgi:hypothetical protein
MVARSSFHHLTIAHCGECREDIVEAHQLHHHNINQKYQHSVDNE